MTRDRKELDAEWCGHSFTVVDTGGWLSAGDPLDAQVSAQAERAIAEADVVLLVVDVTVGVIDEDLAVARVLKRSGRPVRVVVNKVDSSQREADAWDAMALGLGEPWPISALHGRGTGDLLDDVVRLLPARRRRPGSSAGEPGGHRRRMRARWPGWRWWAGPTSGSRPCSTGWSVTIARSPTTRRAPPATRWTRSWRPRMERSASWTPPGCAERAGPSGGPSTSRWSGRWRLWTVRTSPCLVIDATAGVTHQDQRLAERIGASGCPTVVVLNKWELVATEDRTDVLIDIGDRLAFLGEAPVLKVSALTGFGVHHILPAVAAAEEAYHTRIPTGELNRAIGSIQTAHPPVGARIQYAVQGASDPPTFTLVHQRPAPAHLSSLRGTWIAGTLRIGPDADQAAGEGQGCQRGRGPPPVRGRASGPSQAGWLVVGGRNEPCPGVISAMSGSNPSRSPTDGELPDLWTDASRAPARLRGISSSCWWPASSTWAIGPFKASPGSPITFEDSVGEFGPIIIDGCRYRHLRRGARVDRHPPTPATSATAEVL